MTQELEKQQPGAGKLMEYHGVALNRQQADLVVNTLWPGAPAAEKMKAVMLCVQYELNPLMKHLFLIPFGQGEKQTWAVVLGIQANRLIAHRAGDFSYLDETPRMMTEEEQIHILGEVDKANLQAITKLRDSKGNTAQGYGNWPKGKVPYGMDKGNNQANMAFIRSERNAMDRLFAGRLPQGVEVADAQYVVEVSEVKPKGLPQADKETGEIKEPPQPEPERKQDEENEITAILVWNGIKALKQESAFAKLLHDKYDVNMGGKTVREALIALSPEQLAEVRAEVNSRQEMAK